MDCVRGSSVSVVWSVALMMLVSGCASGPSHTYQINLQDGPDPSNPLTPIKGKVQSNGTSRVFAADCAGKAINKLQITQGLGRHWVGVLTFGAVKTARVRVYCTSGSTSSPDSIEPNGQRQTQQAEDFTYRVQLADAQGTPSPLTPNPNLSARQDRVRNALYGMLQGGKQKYEVDCTYNDYSEGISHIGIADTLARHWISVLTFGFMRSLDVTVFCDAGGRGVSTAGGGFPD